jgi:SP family arabinose:H+ symporter-like MFS transporter
VWTSDAILNQLFPLMRDGWGKSMTFYAFATILIPQFYFVWKIMPETKGRSLAAIERSWHHVTANTEKEIQKINGETLLQAEAERALRK